MKTKASKLLSEKTIRFPDIELVDSIPAPGHPVGRYIRHRRQIQLSRKELQSQDVLARKFALYHEAGHWWRTERISDSDVAGPEDEEAFADAFAFYFLKTNLLDNWDFANGYKAVMERLSTGQEAKVRAFVEKAF